MQDVAGRAFFDDAPQVHHGNPLAEIARHAQVVGNEDQRQAHFTTEAAQQIEQLRLHRDIQASDRLVGYDRSGLGRQRPCDGNPADLTTRELTREPIGHIGREPDLVEQRKNTRFDFGFGAQAMKPQGLSENRPNPHPWIH